MENKTIEQLAEEKYPKRECWYGTPPMLLDDNLRDRNVWIEGYKAGYTAAKDKGVGMNEGEKEKRARKSLNALYVQVAPVIAKDVEKNVLAAFEEIRQSPSPPSPVAEDCIAVGFAEWAEKNEWLNGKRFLELWQDYKLSPEYKLLTTTNQSQISSNQPLPDGGKIDWDLPQEEIEILNDLAVRFWKLCDGNSKDTVLYAKAKGVIKLLKSRPEFQQGGKEDKK